MVYFVYLLLLWAGRIPSLTFVVKVEPLYHQPFLIDIVIRTRGPPTQKLLIL